MSTAARPLAGLHELRFEPEVRFARLTPDGPWTCLVCGQEAVAKPFSDVEAWIAKHKALIHVVMVYPHGMPESRRRAKKSARL